MERAIFAGGCFWCMVKPFDSLPGIESVISGYTGGTSENPTYLEVKSGQTGHTEAVEIIYDPSVISYNELVEIYWQQTDPTDAFGQFEDRGSSYRPVIYFFDENQKEIAKVSRDKLQNSGRFTEKIVTQIEPATTFYPAEEEHQEYYQRNPENYTINAERRKKFIKEFWE
ncbi:MAG: peptide-methionine (S)-S-oxide reductase MsrA [Enterococcus sp.]|uniref:peptide-methionine (S)-S-oxide reductase MsrA n=1 Tax=Enterococcus sp. TaxID=35783 RepID=UPI002FC86D5B